MEALIKEVESIPCGQNPGVYASSKVPSASSPVTTEEAPDASWAPSVPLGHTPYSWGKAGRLGNAVPEADHSGGVRTMSTSAPKSQPQSQPQPQPQPQKPAQEKPKQQPQEKQQQPQQKQQQQPKQNDKQGKDQNQGKQKDQKQQQKGKQEPKSNVPDFYQLDIRVGRIKDAWAHPDADSLYVEHIDLGEPEPRQVLSGLRQAIPLEEFKGSDVCVIVNLKPATMRGITSYGMVLAASNQDRSKIELVKPPQGTPLGARVYLEGDEAVAFDYTPAEEVNIKSKTNPWATVAPDLLTDANRVANYKGRAMRVQQGPLIAPTLAVAKIS